MREIKLSKRKEIEREKEMYATDWKDSRVKVNPPPQKKKEKMSKIKLKKKDGTKKSLQLVFIVFHQIHSYHVEFDRVVDEEYLKRK